MPYMRIKADVGAVKNEIATHHKSHIRFPEELCGKLVEASGVYRDGTRYVQSLDWRWRGYLPDECLERIDDEEDERI